MSLTDSLGILHMENHPLSSNTADGKQATTKVACRNCRSVKKKCDGLQPICGPCFKRGLNQPCIYTSANSVIKVEIPAPKTSSLPCLNCKKRKVRCDRIKPECGACSKSVNQTCSFREPPKRLPLQGHAEINGAEGTEAEHSLSSRLLAEASSKNDNKRPRLSSPARLQAGSANEVEKTTIGSGSKRSSMRMRNSGPASKEEAEIAQNGTDYAPVTKYTRIDSLRHSSAHRTRASEESEDREQNDAKYRSSLRQNQPESEAATRRHDTYPKSSDTVSSEFMVKLHQTVSTRTDSTRTALKYQTRQEQKRRSYNGKCISGLKPMEPNSTSFDLPSRELADRLVQLYLKWENANLPILDICNFRLMYEKLWERNTFPGDAYIFYALLNAIFALGCLITSKPSKDEACVFHDRSRTTLDSAIIYDETVSHVQVHILSSRFLYATGSLGQAWNKISLAVSLAQSLDLHLTSSSQSLKVREDRELVRKVWHNCMVTQRTIAMAKGLSKGLATVTDSFLTLFPAPLESEYIDVILNGEQSLYMERPSIIEFFNGLAKLYNKFEEISAFQDEIRSKGIGLSFGKLKSIGLQPFLDLDRSLSDWKDSLPSFLRPGNNHSTLQNPIVLRHRNILSVQYLYTHLLLRRPFLSIFLSSDQGLFAPLISATNNYSRRYSVDIPLSLSIIGDSALRCVFLAREILEIIHQNRNYKNMKEDEPELIPPWWENVGYIYSCSVVLLVSRTSYLIRARLSPQFIEEGCRRGVGLLKSYSDCSDKAEKCCVALKIMSDFTGGTPSNEEVGGSNGDGYTSPQDLKSQIPIWLESLPADLEE